jgi:hypothetical protein
MTNTLGPVKAGDLITSDLINKMIALLQGAPSAPTGVPAPNLFGLTLGQAVSLLRGSTSSVQLGGILDVFGTSVAPTDPIKIGLLVVGQSPSWGVVVPAGTGVNLVIAAAVAISPSKVPTITGFLPATGQSVGLTLDIIGTNFDTLATNNVVTIGGVVATIQNSTSNNAQNLLVTVPVGADTAHQPAAVVVTTQSGGASSPVTVPISASTGVQPPTITGITGAAVQTAGSLALITAGTTTGVDITIAGTGFGTDASKVFMFLGNPATAGVASLTPTVGTSVTATTMTLHVPPASTIASGSLKSTPVLVVNGVQGPASAITLQIT